MEIQVQTRNQFARCSRFPNMPPGSTLPSNMVVACRKLVRRCWNCRNWRTSATGMELNFPRPDIARVHSVIALAHSR